MKIISLPAKLIVSIILLISTVTFAEANVVRTCELTTWCQLPRTSDIAMISVYKKTDFSYTCTLVAEGTRGQAQVQFRGVEGYNTRSTPTVVTDGIRATVSNVTGNFEHSKTGKIKVRRFPDETDTQKVFVMCEKKFKH